MADQPLSGGGLTAQQVAERVAAGLVNTTASPSSRSWASIVAANLFTRFNAILGGLLVVILVTGDMRDGLFGLVLVANSGVGIIQELRAKRALDRLALLSTPEVAVLRDGAVTVVAIAEVVVDDVVLLHAGDQIVVDGTIVGATGLEIDESLLTGESDTVAKQQGDDVLSGSFVAAGTGGMRATRVGRNAYAATLAKEAGAFTLARSELRTGTDWLLRLVTWGLVPAAVLLVVSQLRAHASLSASLSAAVAGVVAMVPEGLVLLTSGAFAVAVVRLARRSTLVQQLPAVETLARVDVLCLDKTGTLTEGVLAVERIEVLDPDVDAAQVLGAVAAADPDPNATMRAIVTRYPGAPAWPTTGSVPFSSRRKWAGVAFSEHGAWFLGAPDVLLEGSPAAPGVLARVAAHTAEAKRVLLLASAPALGVASDLPGLLDPVALVILADRLRPEAPDTVRYFAEQGVGIKIISGDDPRTVAAVARAAGVPGAEAALDARNLPETAEGLAPHMARTTMFGRVTPHQKREMVTALQAAGHVVGMTGDGVNDVLALKRADMGIAIGSGASASRAVAEVVLLDGNFANLPAVLAEGRRVIGNIERVAKLFVTKSVYSLLLALAIGAAGLPFPFLPRHLTLVGSLTIGIPGLVLALAPNTQRAQPGFAARVLRAALPAGIVAAAATFLAYSVARLQFDVNVDEARTTATLVLGGVGLLVLASLLRPLTRERRGLLLAMAALFGLVLVLPAPREFFALESPPPMVWLACVGIVAMSGLALFSGARLAGYAQRPGTARGWSRVQQAAAAHFEVTAHPPTRPAAAVLLEREESAALERKSSLRWDRRQQAVNRDLERAVAKTVAAFLNAKQGGTLLLGVDDAGQVLGLQDDYASLTKQSRDGFHLHLTQLLAKYLGGAVVPRVHISFESIGARDICVLAVDPADGPVYLRDAGRVAFYARLGNASRELPVDEAVQFVRARWAGRS